MRRQNRIFFIFGIILLLSEIWKQYCLTYIVNPGSYDWWYFPFQLCSIPMYVCLLLPFAVPESIHRAMEAFLMDFGLLGGIFAFFDTCGISFSLLSELPQVFPAARRAGMISKTVYIFTCPAAALPAYSTYALVLWAPSICFTSIRLTVCPRRSFEILPMPWEIMPEFSSI